MATPIYRFVADGKDITSLVKGRLISASVTDKQGMESDSASLIIDNTKAPYFEGPEPGGSLEIWLGWKVSGLVRLGSYTVDKTSEQFGPDRLVIDAKAADMGAQLKEQKRRSWANTTIGAVVDQIAREHNLSSVVSPDLAALPLAHLDQTDEGDMNLLTRLARERGALAKFADKRLIFAPKGQAKELLTGAVLPLVTIDQGECSPGSTLDRRERNNYKSVRAFWYSDDEAERKEVLTGDGRPTYTIRNKYRDEEGAARAAKAKLAEFKRGALSMTLSLSRGRPELFAEAPAVFTGFPSHRLPGQRFILTDVSHSFGDGGFTSRITAETNPSEDS